MCYVLQVESMTAPFLTLPSFDFPDVVYGFFTREGGVSESVYTSLNCGLGSKDNQEHVKQNRARIVQALGAKPGKLATCYQIHSDKVEWVDETWAYDRPQADALVTKTPGIVLGILTADCGPVLFHDPVSKTIAAAHAGWRGALGEVLEETIALMENHGALTQNIQAVLGPCIRQPSYEVSGDFPDAFALQDEAKRTFFMPSTREGHFMFDLPGYITHRLHKAGLVNVSQLGVDTYADEARFFSYRRATHREEGVTGSLMSAIMLR